MYDDRGLDIIANDIETLRPVYDLYRTWILDGNKEQIDKLFSNLKKTTMKYIYFIALTLFAFNSFGQTIPKKVTPQNAAPLKNVDNDTLFKVFYKNEIDNKIKPAYFLNGKHISEKVFNAIAVHKIENLEVEGGSLEIENIKYVGKILVKTKAHDEPELISLNNLKLKHTNINDGFVIFQIDDKIINSDYNDFLVDENYILKIVVEKHVNEVENFRLKLINIYTKSEENIKKSKQIMIRGNTGIAINKQPVN